MIAALILTAGKGVRFGSGTLPKQFAEIDGVPLFIHSVRTYVGVAEVDKVTVVANPTLVEQTKDALEQHGLLSQVELIAGGDTRQVSVQNAAESLNKDLNAEDIVILHNGVSPNTSAEFIRQCLAAMVDSDAVQACVPEIRTVFEVDGEFVGQVLQRSSLVYNCDPTVYRGDVFKRVTEAQKQQGMSGDTTSDMARNLGFRIRLVESSYDNIKVTNRWDLEAVRAAMKVAPD